MITRHSLPQSRLVSVNGSQVNANCSNITGSNNNICAGTSVLNDGVIPAVDTSNTAWASQLFTLDANRRVVTLSFELESENHDRIALAVFNCPRIRIGFSSISVYFDSSFRPDRDDSALGTFITDSQVTDTSCDHLLEICVKYDTTLPPTQFINLQIPISASSDYVFLGEVTFLNGGSDLGKSCHILSYN